MLFGKGALCAWDAFHCAMPTRLQHHRWARAGNVALVGSLVSFVQEVLPVAYYLLKGNLALLEIYDI